MRPKNSTWRCSKTHLSRLSVMWFSLRRSRVAIRLSLSSGDPCRRWGYRHGHLGLLLVRRVVSSAIGERFRLRSKFRNWAVYTSRCLYALRTLWCVGFPSVIQLVRKLSSSPTLQTIRLAGLLGRFLQASAFDIALSRLLCWLGASRCRSWFGHRSLVLPLFGLTIL